MPTIPGTPPTCANLKTQSLSSVIPAPEPESRVGGKQVFLDSRWSLPRTTIRGGNDIGPRLALMGMCPQLPPSEAAPPESERRNGQNPSLPGMRSPELWG